VNYSSAATKEWMNLVTERTNGAITFNDNWGGALGSGAELFEKLENRAVDVIHDSQTAATAKFPVCMFQFPYPFGPTDPRIVLETSRQFYGEFGLDMDLAKYNAKLIAQFPSPPYNILSKVPIATVADLNGKRIGAFGRWWGFWLEPAGAVLVAAPGVDRYEMLRTGLIDASLLPTVESYGNKVHEQTTYIIDLPLMSHSVWELIIRKDLLESFSPEVQRILVESGHDAEEKAVNELLPAWEATVWKAWEDAGLQLIDFPDAEIAKLAGLLEDTPAVWAKELEALGYPGWEMVKRYQEITANLGFQWARQWGVR
jgi:TRAP-type C4-dicarboxylate transport system substrate-binding protein